MFDGVNLEKKYHTVSDMFEKVVPLAVHNALVVFETRKQEIVNMEIGRLREATTLVNR